MSKFDPRMMMSIIELLRSPQMPMGADQMGGIKPPPPQTWAPESQMGKPIGDQPLPNMQKPPGSPMAPEFDPLAPMKPMPKPMPKPGYGPMTDQKLF